MKPKILFLCTANACRSQMAEALLRHLAGHRFEAFSAGAAPAGFVHPLAHEAMDRLHVPMDGQTSKSWDDFDNVPLDAVITLCDSAAKQPCPTGLRAPIMGHWSTPDPASHLGDEEDRIAFAVLVANRLRSKLEALIRLDWSAPRETIAANVRALGEI